MPQWYGENGQYVTTKFFGMKINRYMHDHDISPTTLAKVAAKNYRNGSLNPKAFRRKPLSVDEILASPMLNHPLTAYDVLRPRRRRSGGRALPGRPGLPLHRCAGVREGNRDPNAQLRRLRGQHDVGRIDEDVSPTVYAPRRRTRQAGIGPDEVDVIQLQDTDAGAEVITWPRTASVSTASRRSSSPRTPRRSPDRCRSTPTAGSSPTANPSVPPACGRSTSS